MERRVADVMWEMLAKAGVKRCYGIVGDALKSGDRRAPAQRRDRVYQCSSRGIRCLRRGRRLLLKREPSGGLRNGRPGA